MKIKRTALFGGTAPRPNPEYILNKTPTGSDQDDAQIIELDWKHPDHDPEKLYGVQWNGSLYGPFTGIGRIEHQNGVPCYLATFLTGTSQVITLMIVGSKSYHIADDVVAGNEYKIIIGLGGHPELHVIQRTICHVNGESPSPFAI